LPLIAGQLTFDLFPASGLDNSLFTAIFLGLLLLFLLTESFGWVFTGLVVPGYLASVFVIQPVAGAVILVEAIATYFVSRAVSDWGSRVLPYNRFFGRERFFLILLISVAVRLLFEAVLLPLLGALLVDSGWVPPTLMGNLFSVGLIVVPLTANMMWRTGAWAGLPQVVLPTAVIYLALQLVLIPYTNLSISDFELSYENVALGFLASPKTYIILLTGAYLANRNSQAWGWDSHGIVVMALVALAWLSPMKVLTTVVEVLLLVAVVRVALSLPPVQRANIEGYRRIVFVFGIGFALKFVACHAMAASYPGLRATDYFGFGYLLPSLLALKILQKGSASIVLFPTLQTSLVALALGTVLGLGLTLADPSPSQATLSPVALSAEDEVRSGVIGEVHRAAGRLLSGLPPATRKGIDPRPELAAYRSLVRALVAGEDGLSEDAESLGLIVVDLVDAGDHQRYRLLKEPPGRTADLRGWGVVATRVGASSSLVIEVPHPVSEPRSLVAGAVLFRELGAAALVVSGVDPGPEAALWRSARESLGLPSARRALEGRPALEVRAPAAASGSTVWVRGALPSALDASALEAVVGVVAERHEPPPDADVYGYAPEGERARLDLGGDAALAASQAAYPRLSGSDVVEPGGLSALANREWFTGRIRAVAYRPPRETERLFVDRELLTPLLGAGPQLLDDDATLDLLRGVAALVGYRLERIRLGDGERLLLLSERAPAVRGWGSVLVRPAAGTARFVSVPKPGEERYTLDLALHMMRDLDGAALLVAGAEPTAVLDASSNVVGEGNLETVFTQAHRAALRVSSERGPQVGLQVRGYRSWRPLRSPVILASGVLSGRGHPAGIADLAVRLDEVGVPVRGYDGSQELVALRGYGIPQIHLARNLDGSAYGVLWASRDLRRRVAAREGEALTRVAERAGVEPSTVWLQEVWDEAVGRDARVTAGSLTEPPPDLEPGFAEALQHCEALIRTGDQRYLGDALWAARAQGLEVTWIVDLESDLPVLLLRGRHQLVAVNLLTSRAEIEATIEDPVACLRTGLVPLLVAEAS